MTVDWAQMLGTTLRGACPRCRDGRVFQGLYTLRSRCPECRLDLVGRDGAHFGGAIALGYGIGGVAGLVAFALLFSRFGFQTWVVWASVAAVILSVLMTFRHCKAWWTWWLFSAGELGGGRN